MNIVELAEAVSVSAKITKSEAELITREIFDQIAMGLGNGEEVKIAGFGTFVSKTRAARKGINPSTGEPIDIAESKQVGFKAAKHLKDQL